MPRVTFANQKKPFFNSINDRVEEYFYEKKLKKTGNKKLYVKTLILITGALMIYIVLLTIHVNPFMGVALCVLLGFLQATIGFNVMHDANHGSFSERKWVNNLMGFSANIMGINMWLWKQKHNIIHHTYTNIDGVDIDLAKAPFLRMCPSQKQLKVHRFQHIYCIPLYALTSLMMIFVSEFLNFFRKKIQGTKLQKMKISEKYVFWISKAVYVFFFIALPALIWGIVPAIIGFTAMHVALGIILAIVFQLAHVVEATQFVDANVVRIEDEWAVHQVQTTADFATDNKIISWFTGGLNFQVEHHLFPKISHVHYPAIHKILKEDCDKFSIRLNDYPTMTAAFLSHLRFLKQLGAN